MIAPAPRYDLHTHSTASDGTLTPTGLIEHAAAAGVTHLALTDHDSTAGLDEARRAATRTGISLINGVEISASWNHRTLHIVGLGIDPDHPPLAEGLLAATRFRQQRAERIAEKLDQAGIPNALEGAGKLCRGQTIARTHFARFLVECGHAKDTRQVFKRFLVKGRPGYVASQWVALETAVNWINDASGLAVIAHPARYKLSRTKLTELVDDFKAMGGIGIEVVSGSHSASETREIAQITRDADCLASAGSDYHGPEKPWIELGRLPALPPRVTPIWEKLGQSHSNALT